MKYLWRISLFLASLGFLGLIAGMAGVAMVISYYGADLPDYSQLKDYDPPIVTRLYAGDGRLMAEFAQEKRIFVPIGSIPDLVKNAFIAAEDQNFYKHKGVDPAAIARAVVSNLKGSGLSGASTITQQVAKNFFLTKERTYARKIREAILAYRMEQALTKDRLLELYLNQIYLGAHAYGVAAAAQQYFNKSLSELSVGEAAYLAALPKAPNNYNPAKNYDGAVERRNYVIGRLRKDGYITPAEADLAMAAPLLTAKRDETSVVNAPFFAEEVRRELAARYGKDSLYQGGLVARTTLDPRLQETALRSLRDGLQAYDRRHGYRGPFAHYDTMGDWKAQLETLPRPVDMPDEWRLAAVLDSGASAADLGFADGSKGTLKLENLQWAREYLDEGYAQGPEITSAGQVLKEGDIVMVEPVAGEPSSYALRQIPLLQGAVIAMDPHTGRILAMQGGWKYKYGASEYNRATQAKRQPGSAFKPFIYAAALERGFTPSSLIMDAPFVIEDRPGHFWSPVNYHEDFSGPTTIRVALEKSKNLVTVRLAHHLGMPVVKDYAERFGIVDDMPSHLSGALGAIETTPLRLTAAYASFVNGGKKITPTIIDRIQDRRGKTIFRHDGRGCDSCGPLIKWEGQAAPDVADTRPQVIDPRVAYQMTHILEGVVQRGTAAALKGFEWPLAGKTGTTNKSKDTWFIGFSPDLVVGVFMGFDDPRSLGKKETGASVAVPVFGDFMKAALKDSLPTPFRIPPGIKNIQVNAKTGQMAQPGDQNLIWEAFASGAEPNGESYILNGSGVNVVPDEVYEDGDNGEDNGEDNGDDEKAPGWSASPEVWPETRGPGSSSDEATTGTGGLY